MNAHRRFFPGLLALIVASVAASVAAAATLGPTTEGCCGQRMSIAGDARYYAPKDAKTSTGVSIPEGFASEVYGKMLVLTAELPKGTYTIEVEASENSYAKEAQRYFDVIVGNQPLARAVDLYKLAGGDGKPYTITGTVDHPGGPLKIILMARVDNAKFSIIHILDAQGNKVAWALSDDMKDIAAAEIPPIIIGPEIWRDTAKPMETRAADLVRRMTLREKVGQMMFQAPAIERLNIPTYNYWNECLHGVARNGHATVFPQAIGMAASFDTDLLHTVADTISTEARAKHEESARAGERGIYQGLNFWTPNINIFRDPRWGRGQETYGEDPYLTSRMGVAFITGLQGTDPTYFKVIATAKHFAVHSGPENLHHVFDAQPTELDFYETYLPQFEAAVKEAHVYSVMGSYNRVYGAPATASPLLLEDLLRKQWGFKGFIVSDCGAIDDIWANHKVVSNRAEAAALAVKTGTDLECGSDYSSLIAAVDLKLITEKEIDTAVTRVMLARFRLGMFDPPEKVPYSKIAITDYDTPAHANIALKMARESIVLLKNDNNLLPLKKNLKKIAIVGPNAESLLPLLGNYNGTPTRITTVADGIRAAAPNAEIISIRGCDNAERPSSFLLVPDAVLRANNKTGLHAEYFPTEDLSGKPIITRQDKSIDFNGSIEGYIPNIPDAKGSIRWTGEFVAPAAGKYRLLVAALPAGSPMGHRVWINNKLVDSRWDKEAGNMIDPIVDLQAGESVPIKIECHHSTAYIGMALFWDRTDADAIPQVLEQVKGADAIVFVSGLDGRMEAEEGDVRGLFIGFSGGDRDLIELPAPQENLLKALAATNIPIVMVNMTGSAIAMPWEAKNIPAIVQAWYPGQSGGRAVADVLFGDVNPSGKLPITFYAATTDLPPFTDYNMQPTPDTPGRTYRYFNGKPLFPFGHGLSYTQFDYGKISLTSTADSATASLDITNSGQHDGDEIIQLYARPPASVTSEPAHKLVAFKRVSIPAGKTSHVEIPIRFQDLQTWDTQTKSYIVTPGIYTLEAGTSSSDIRITQDFPVKQ